MSSRNNFELITTDMHTGDAAQGLAKSNQKHNRPLPSKTVREGDYSDTDSGQDFRGNIRDTDDTFRFAASEGSAIQKVERKPNVPSWHAPTMKYSEDIGPTLTADIKHRERQPISREVIDSFVDMKELKEYLSVLKTIRESRGAITGSYLVQTIEAVEQGYPNPIEAITREYGLRQKVWELIIAESGKEPYSLEYAEEQIERADTEHVAPEHSQTVHFPDSTEPLFDIDTTSITPKSLNEEPEGVSETVPTVPRVPVRKMTPPGSPPAPLTYIEALKTISGTTPPPHPPQPQITQVLAKQEKGGFWKKVKGWFR